MRRGLLLVAVSLALLPSAEASALQTVYSGPLDGTVNPLGDRCLIAGIAGWPPQPRLDLDCIGSESNSVPPPSDLRATYDAATETVQLTWQAPDGANAFNVYRNGELIATVTEPIFEDDDLPLVLVYEVTALFAQNESSSAMTLLVTVPVVWACPPLILGSNPDPPFVAHIDWGCLPLQP